MREIHILQTLFHSIVVESYQNQSYPSIVVGDCKEFQCFDTQNWLIVTGRLNKLPYKMLPHPSVFVFVPLSIYKVIIGVFNTDFKIAITNFCGDAINVQFHLFM